MSALKKIPIIAVALGSLLLSFLAIPLTSNAAETNGFKIQYNWINENTGESVLPQKNDSFDLGSTIKTRDLEVDGFTIDNLKSTVKQGDPTGFINWTYKEALDRTGYFTMNELIKKFYNGRTVTSDMKDGYCTLTTYLVPNK
ncbi:hypothetical protein ACGWYS_002608 [Enterococcus faecalis]|uniref:hypothetical protein n=1 Tax=Enterococcus faecalis TaxID=1351 RepID=UPI0025B0B3EC|nr:hypothetical protein [Enterococcus faecalis]MDN3077095.1 hypothetical protein [Enterococcus faecalis]